MIPVLYRFSRSYRAIIALGLVVLLYCAVFQPRIPFGDYIHEPPPEPEKELVYIADGDKVLPISSRRHINNVYNTVDGLGLDPNLFNPALIELPKGSKHEFMVIARVGHVEVEIDGILYRLAKQVAFFADLHTDAEGVVSLRRGSSARTILDGEFAMPPKHNCTSADGVMWNVNQYIGPEDTRLYWTNAGAPLLQFTSQIQAEDECQGIFIVDARAVIPELVEAFGDHAAKLPPIKIDKPRHVRRPRPAPILEPTDEELESPPENPHEREKNWAPFEMPPFVEDVNRSEPLKNHLLFHVQPYEQRVYRFEPAAEVVEPVYEPNPTETQACFDDRMHQATPLLSLTLCKRGKCKPDVDNTVLIGVIQKLRVTPFYKWYQAHVVTWNATEPFVYRSVSRRISYLGMEEGRYAWTCGLVYQWNSSTIPANRSHGFLDDWMLLSFGISDNGAGWDPDLNSVPVELDDKTPNDLREAHDYYLTPRCQHPNAQNKMLVSSTRLIMNFDAFDLIDELLSQPVQVIVGEKAESKWHTDRLVKILGGVKEEIVVPKGTYMDFYDKLDYVNPSVDNVARFMKSIVVG